MEHSLPPTQLRPQSHCELTSLLSSELTTQIAAASTTAAYAIHLQIISLIDVGINVL